MVGREDREGERGGERERASRIVTKECVSRVSR